MEKKQIVDFIVGDKIENFFIIKDLNIRTSKSDKKYMDLILGDSTGKIDSKLWNVTQEVIATYKTGDLIKVRGTVTSWQDNLQFKIEKIRKSTDEDDLNIMDYVISAPIDPDEMFNEIKSYIDAMENIDIKSIVHEIVFEYKEQLMYYPAAKSNHHAIRSGLLYHILRMLKTAKQLSIVYDVDTDLLFAGVILHDIEKIHEMESDELGVVSNYSVEGQLLGHIYMGMQKIHEVGKRIDADEEIVKMLQHMLYSHHYYPEYGSPVKPMFKEAELLHYIDVIDARMYDFQNVLEDIDPGTTSDPIWVLDKRRVYRRKDK